MIIDTAMNFPYRDDKIRVDLLILAGNPKFYISNFKKSFTAEQIVIDSSVPAWKSRLWKKDCDTLHIPCHNVSEEGAFVMKL